MAETQIILGDWNSITPAAPAGRENIIFAVDRTGAIPKFSASVETTFRVATFLVGIGAAIAAADDIAPVYRVKKAGTALRCLARAKNALDESIALMIMRNRNTSPATLVEILGSPITIEAGSTEWIETTTFENDDLEVDDELQLNLISGAAQDITIEFMWS
jgi:hypothetical protein